MSNVFFRGDDIVKLNKEIVHKYLYPIMYKNDEGIIVVYSDDFNNLVSELSEENVNILNGYLTRNAIPVVDPSLDKNEQLQLARSYKEEKARKEEVYLESIEEISQEDETVSELLAFSLADLTNYLCSDKKNAVNKSFSSETPYYIEHLHLDNDKDRVFVIADCIVNKKEDFILDSLITENTEYASILGVNLKTLASYYDIDKFGVVDKASLNERTLRDINLITESINICTIDRSAEVVADFLPQVLGQKK